MTKAAASLAAAVLAAGVLSQPGAAKAQPYAYPPDPVAWMVGPGYYGFSGYPVARAAVSLGPFGGRLWAATTPSRALKALGGGSKSALESAARRAGLTICQWPENPTDADAYAPNLICKRTPDRKAPCFPLSARSPGREGASGAWSAGVISSPA